MSNAAHMPPRTGVSRRSIAMLNDTDRNKKYSDGIREMIEQFQTRYGRSPTVVDLGAGSGLLSIIALRHGAAHVTALEANQDLAAVARQQIAQAFPDEGRWAVENIVSVDFEQRGFDMLVCDLVGPMLNSESMYLYMWDLLMRKTIRNFGTESDPIFYTVPQEGTMYLRPYRCQQAVGPVTGLPFAGMRETFDAVYAQPPDPRVAWMRDEHMHFCLSASKRHALGPATQVLHERYNQVRNGVTCTPDITIKVPRHQYDTAIFVLEWEIRLSPATVLVHNLQAVSRLTEPCRLARWVAVGHHFCPLKRIARRRRDSRYSFDIKYSPSDFVMQLRPQPAAEVVERTPHGIRNGKRTAAATHRSGTQQAKAARGANGRGAGGGRYEEGDEDDGEDAGERGHGRGEPDGGCDGFRGRVQRTGTRASGNGQQPQRRTRTARNGDRANGGGGDGGGGYYSGSGDESGLDDDENEVGDSDREDEAREREEEEAMVVVEGEAEDEDEGEDEDEEEAEAEGNGVEHDRYRRRWDDDSDGGGNGPSRANGNGGRLANNEGPATRSRRGRTRRAIGTNSPTTGHGGGRRNNSSSSRKRDAVMQRPRVSADRFCQPQKKKKMKSREQGQWQSPRLQLDLGASDMIDDYGGLGAALDHSSDGDDAFVASPFESPHDAHRMGLQSSRLDTPGTAVARRSDSSGSVNTVSTSHNHATSTMSCGRGERCAGSPGLSHTERSNSEDSDHGREEVARQRVVRRRRSNKKMQKKSTRYSRSSRNNYHSNRGCNRRTRNPGHRPYGGAEEATSGDGSSPAGVTRGHMNSNSSSSGGHRGRYASASSSPSSASSPSSSSTSTSSTSITAVRRSASRYGNMGRGSRSRLARTIACFTASSTGMAASPSTPPAAASSPAPVFWPTSFGRRQWGWHLLLTNDTTGTGGVRRLFAGY